MIQEFKFNAWIKTQNKMLWNVSFVKYGDGWNGGNPEYKFYQIYYQKGGYFLALATEVEILPYIDVKDNNGEEIYKGDVLKAYWCNGFSWGTGYFKAVVEWNKAGYVYKIIEGDNVKIGGYIYPKDFKNEDLTGQHEYFDRCGNIYENPELLKA